ncbi:MAG: hypothetical protein PHE50_06235 [Dehalococcoidales bacterium]|nr:hypothetical protein [Dehalococcoidales bacterium]
MVEEIELEEKKKRGAPEGNQNARTHGFYSHILNDEERADYEAAVKVEGLDEEIALMRVKIKTLVQADPENIRLIMQAVNALERMISTKYNLRKEDKQSIREAIGNVLKDIALPLGIGLGTAMKK